MSDVDISELVTTWRWREPATRGETYLSLIAPRWLTMHAIPSSVFFNHANDALMVGHHMSGADLGIPRSR
jgi:hypothetical protein